MAVLTMPAAVWTKRSWTPPAQNQVNRSGWTGARKVVRLPGAALWKVTAAIKPLTREVDAWPWQAFLAALEGEANTFLMPRSCKQTTANNPVIGTGAVQGATTGVRLDGMPANALFLRGGRPMTFLLPNGRYQMVLLTQDLVANNEGQGIATFRGALRAAIPPGTVVETRDPVCEMEMVGGSVPLDESEGVYTLAFDAVEAF